MNKQHKILIIAFTALLLLTIGEIIYYFFFLSPKTQPNNPLPTQNSTNSNIPSQYTNPAPAIDRTILTNLGLLTDDILISSQISNEYEGEIVEINTKEQSIKGKDGTNYTYNLKILIINGPTYTHTLRYSKEDVSKLKVVASQENGAETPIDVNDLKVGDKIRIQEKLNLKEVTEKSMIDFKIIKI